MKPSVFHRLDIPCLPLCMTIDTRYDVAFKRWDLTVDYLIDASVKRRFNSRATRRMGLPPCLSQRCTVERLTPISWARSSCVHRLFFLSLFTFSLRFPITSSLYKALYTCFGSVVPKDAFCQIIRQNVTNVNINGSNICHIFLTVLAILR